jgi:hypothetical protein
MSYFTVIVADIYKGKSENKVIVLGAAAEPRNRLKLPGLEFPTDIHPFITSEFPALAARELGLGDVPLMCFVEMDVQSAMPRVIRLMIYAEMDKARGQIQHVYLRGATALRLDLAQ